MCNHLICLRLIIDLRLLNVPLSCKSNTNTTLGPSLMSPGTGMLTFLTASLTASVSPASPANSSRNVVGMRWCNGVDDTIRRCEAYVSGSHPHLSSLLLSGPIIANLHTRGRLEVSSISTRGFIDLPLVLVRLVIDASSKWLLLVSDQTCFRSIYLEQKAGFSNSFCQNSGAPAEALITLLQGCAGF